MKSVIKIVVAVVSVFFASTSFATYPDRVTGRIQMIFPWAPAGSVYVRIVGNPVLDGGNCPLYEYLARIDDPNFKTLIYLVLLAAKAADAEVTLIVQGCVGAYPIIAGVQYSPAQ